MKGWIAAVAALAIVGCGGDEPDKIKIDLNDATPASTTPEVKSDPNGKYTCLKCNGFRTNETKCPKCGESLAAAPPPPKPPTSAKSGETVGKSTTSAVYACPEAGCEITFPAAGACLKHKETQMKLQYFVCAKCSVKEPVKGKCSKCGADLKRTLE